MSSSAALESTYAYALNDLFGDNKIDKFELAKVGCLLYTSIQPIFLTGKMFNKNISKQKLFFRQITLNQFIIHASKDLITILLFI